MIDFYHLIFRIFKCYYILRSNDKRNQDCFILTYILNLNYNYLSSIAK